jgi:hypothetical protein
MEIATLLLVITALGGATIAAIRLSGTPRPPLWLALGHGMGAICGVSVLGYTAATVGIPTSAQIALGCFILAALGGLTIFLLFHLKAKPLPIPLVLGHGLIAATGVILLVSSYLQLL